MIKFAPKLEKGVTMERSILKNIEEWCVERRRKPLILMGARQVGKTWLMDEFARRHYPNDTVRVNFMKNDALRDNFEKIDLDPKTVVEIISINTGKKIVPGKTLLILDEIQESPRALTSLKFFNEDMPELAVMAAGSLLGLAVDRNKKRGRESNGAKASFPVGKVTFIDVPPMTFEEFLVAIGEDVKCEALGNRKWEMVNVFNDTYCEFLRKYYFIGGMPEAVLAYSEEKDYRLVRKVQKSILKAYDEDFVKHSDGSLLSKIRLLWGAIPSQLSKENKKFLYTALREGARAREYEVALQWLEDAGMTRIVRNVAAPMMPLAAYEDFSAFKLYAHDVGLIAAMSEIPQQVLLEGSSIFTHFKGSLTEQFALQELTAYGCGAHYWSPGNSRAELEFLVQVGSKICPIEAKAEKNLRAKSLMTYIEKYKPEKAVRLSTSKRMSHGVLEDYPLYSIHEMLMDLDG